MTNPEKTEIVKALSAHLEKIMPRGIDDVIRENRDKGRLYLSTPDELRALQGDVPARHIKAHVSRWAFITMDFMGQKTTHLTGRKMQTHSSTMTSIVVAIAGSAVFTKSGSIYILDGEDTTEPGLLTICATLHQWGLGSHFGVPEFFF